MCNFSYSFHVMAIFHFINWIVSAETIKGGNYSREENICGNTVLTHMFYSSIQKSSLILISIGCNCNTEGSEGSNGCDSTDGKCTCKPNIYDKKCEKCVEGSFGFPNCLRGRFQLSTFPKYTLICFIPQ